MKKLAPLLIALLGLALLIAAVVIWFEPPKEGGVFSTAGSIILFLSGLGTSIKGWMDVFKKEEPTNSIKQELINRSETSTPIQAETVNIYNNVPAPQLPITNSQSSKNTLPYQPYFFGREKELKVITDAIAPESRTWGALIDGPGGIGKTALAIKAAHDAPAELFERKIFITAKVRELTAEGEAKLTDFTRPTYLAMLDELGKELGADGLEKLAPDERPNELRLALAGKKALIVFDNLETLPEEERTRLFQFLSRLPEGNKAIVTSRRRPEAVTQTGDALTDRAYALALQYGGNDNYEGFRMLDAEWDFISAALPCLQTGNNERLQTVCMELFQFLHFTGRWDDIIWLHEQAEARALASDDKENAGWRAYHAGITYFRRNQPANVLVCAARAADHWQGSMSFNKAFAIRLRGLGHKLQKDYPAAIAANRESLEILRGISLESTNVAVGLNSLAEAERENKDYPAAERDYREALLIAKKIKNDEFVATITGNLAGLALDREQWAEAESLAREALPLDEKVGRQELIAGDSHHLAKALLKQNRNLGEALSMSRRAVEIFTRLRQQDNLQEAQETLAEIEAMLKEK